MRQIKEKRRRTKKVLNSNGLAIPRDARPILRGYLYKQEVESSDSPPRMSKWEKVFCVLYKSLLAFYRTKEQAISKPSRTLDILKIDEDFIVRKVKAAAKSSKPSKYKDKNDKINKSRKEMFLITDLEHTNHYYATSSVDVKTKWVEKFLIVIGEHQVANQSKMNKLRRQKAEKERFRLFKNKKAVGVVGSGLSRKEKHQLNSYNSEIQRTKEDLEMLKQGWKDEALRLRRDLEVLKGKNRDKSEDLTKSVKSVSKLVTELEIGGQEKELQAFESRRQRKELESLKERYGLSQSEYSVSVSSQSDDQVSVSSYEDSRNERLEKLEEELKQLRSRRKTKRRVIQDYY